MTATFTDGGGDNVKWIDENGTSWSTTLSGDGQIPAQVRAWVAAGNVIPKFVAPESIAANLPKLLVIDRLEAVGKFAAALSVLQSNKLTYERWSASERVDPANPEVIALLDAIGADKAVILAPE